MSETYYIVSANYRNRDSVYRWLIRREDEDVEKARACKSVRCGHGRFQESTPLEIGFGCLKIYRATEAEGHDFESTLPGQVRLTFDGRDFVVNTDTEFQALFLADNGVILTSPLD